ncbi:Qat anti-phage system TatD family nuclease QatD [Mesorhizobium sp.]|uniref:Qat anti-phage system TatD family nuclease QatD n=1 Tax=Mesorhizobium sp. TaxID=1871066 RepID=UPI001222C383|nr:Qat anti-phage system TatD family nuclease QatD [Mesorhizobium sp.]TIN74387.1 MAG: TatD family deoxyribonuclease [Mesorhizobium sp.]TIO65683.1 MAG: TatD family deoxyribonuclease [Mesorhizobium sp.]TIS24061.1 MAG: TatD family deoxyribonuclease [Mesorhizobium sp.]TJV91155.1 MAG: TatD family deoxyribonuclease [Mesorhizobium sp.]
MIETSNQSAARWVDFHCHVDLYKDHSALIAECDRERVATLAVTTTPKAWPRNRELAAKSAHVRIALGLHPQLVAERENELPIFERYLSDARYVGEIGLDAGPRFYRGFPAQERVFERILRACAEQGGKILTVHSVRAVGKVLNHIESSLPQDRGRVVLHWFTGTSAEARRAVALGCYFSINGEMLRSPKHRQLVGSLPLDRLLTETDGPFVERDGQPLRPRDVGHTVVELAEARNVSAKAMEDAVLQNLRRLVSA